MIEFKKGIETATETMTDICKKECKLGISFCPQCAMNKAIERNYELLKNETLLTMLSQEKRGQITGYTNGGK